MRRMNTTTYVHGHDSAEHQRLQDQAGALQALLHHDTHYPAGTRVLEAGCGVGAQTLTLARQSPQAQFTSVDIDAKSVASARRRVRKAGLTNVELQRADLLALPYAEAAFDHVFVCFVLEHLRRPGQALAALLRHLKPGGTLTVIEGDHGPTFMHPDSAAARAAIQCQVRLQRRGGGNALIGRQLHPLLTAAGCVDVQVSPRLVYVDGSRPDLADAFTLRTFTAMIEGVRDAAIEAGFSSAERFDAGLRGLRRAAQPDGVFGYSFFKAVAIKPPAAPAAPAGPVRRPRS